MSHPGFEFATTPRVLFGEGTLHRLGEEAAPLGRHAWLVTGGAGLEHAGVIERLGQLLGAKRVAFERQAVSAEPDTALVDQGVRSARARGCDLVIAVGGGSVLDAGKAIAALLANGGVASDYLEVVGKGLPVEKPAFPFIAVPTTGGTGSEATCNAVLTHKESGTKASIRHLHLLPRLAIVDPVLTHSVPLEVTASTGLDALAQLIEPYVSRRPNAMVELLALEGIRLAAQALPRVYANGKDGEARAFMSLAALWSGMALAHCGLGAAHAFSGPLGGSFPVPHGFACAALLPHTMVANLRGALQEDGETIRRYAAVALALGAQEAVNEEATAHRGVEIVRRLCTELRVPPLSKYGVTPENVPDLVERAKRTSSMKANPVDLTDEALAEALRAAIG